MPRLVVVTAASLLMLAPALAHRPAPSASLEGRHFEAAWASGADREPRPGMIVGENCYFEQDSVIDPSGRTEHRLELVCD